VFKAFCKVSSLVKPIIAYNYAFLKPDRNTEKGKIRAQKKPFLLERLFENNIVWY